LRLQNYLFFFIRQNFIAFSFPFFSSLRCVFRKKCYLCGWKQNLEIRKSY